MKKRPGVDRASKVNFLLAAAVMVFTHAGRCRASEGPFVGVALHPRFEYVRSQALPNIFVSLKARTPALQDSANIVQEELKNNSGVVGDKTFYLKRGEMRDVAALTFSTNSENRSARDKLQHVSRAKRNAIARGKADETDSPTSQSNSRQLASSEAERGRVGLALHQTNFLTREKRHDELIHNNEGTQFPDENDQPKILIHKTNLPVSENNDSVSESSWKQINSEHDHSKKHRCRHRRRKKGRRRRHRYDSPQQHKLSNHNEDNNDRSKAWPSARSRLETFLLRSDGPSYVITSAANLRKDWCRTVPLRQVVSERGCRPRTIMNSFCYGQCNSFFIPRTDHKVSTAFQSCAFCKPHRSSWTTVTLHCPGLVPPVRRKKVLRVETCRCMAEVQR